MENGHNDYQEYDGDDADNYDDDDVIIIMMMMIVMIVNNQHCEIMVVADL